MYGMFVLGLKYKNDKVCLVQQMEGMAGVVNNLDCPLYSITTNFKLMPSTSVKAEVSFVHECDESCDFVNSGSVIVEREEVTLDKLQYVHNFETNRLYCLNVFCMNQ